MTAASKRRGVNNKTQPKRQLCKQVLAAPVTAQWPSISDAQTQRIKQSIQEAAQGLRDKKRLQPPWSELKKYSKDQRKEAIIKFEEQYLACLDLAEREAFLKTEQANIAKMTEIIVGYNAVMRHLSKGTLAAVLINKSATPEFLAKSFLPGCYCRSIPVAAIENLQEVFGKCIAVGFKESVTEEGSAFHTMYTLMKDSTDDSTQAPPSSTTSIPPESNAENPPTKKNSKRFKKLKVPPPVVDVPLFHLIRGSPEQAAFYSKLSDKQSSGSFIPLGSDTPDDGKSCTSFDFRKKKQFSKSTLCDSSPVLGEGNLTECQKSPSVTDCMEDVFELDYGGENDNKADDEPAYSKAGHVATEKNIAEPPTGELPVMQKSDFAVEDSRSMKRKAGEVEEKFTCASSYVPAAIMRVVGNPKRKKR